MVIRHLEQEDIPAVMKIYEHAREFQRETGNPNQWCANSWPPEEVIAGDAESRRGYVCTENGRICAVFCFVYGKNPEKTYDVIDGRWRDDSWYGVVHRIASDHTVKGAGTYCLEWAYARCGHLRIDTHEDNHVMQNLLAKLHFERCGIIRLENGEPRIAYEKYDPSGRRVFETRNPEEIRVYEDGNVWQSAVYLEEGKHFEPVFPYCRVFSEVFDLHRNPENMLMIGGGMMTFPSYVLCCHRNVSIDVIEPEASLLPLAEKYFFLGEARKNCDPENTRLKIAVSDGRSYLAETEKLYDVIINDAFSGFLPASSLCTLEAASLIRSCLRPGGVYVMNVPGMSEPEESDFLLDEIRTLKEVFRYVLLRVPEGHESQERDNYILFASDQYKRMKGMTPYRLEYTTVITDRDEAHLQDFYESLNQ